MLYQPIKVLCTVILGLKVSGLAVALGYLLSFMISPLDRYIILRNLSLIKVALGDMGNAYKFSHTQKATAQL